MADNRQIDNRPLISVIMNCLNGEKHLRQAIDSVYAQTYQDWEIIFWDNASTDKSADIAKSYDQKLRYFRGETTIPLGAARNRALDQSRGDYIAFLDVDDWWEIGKLNCQIKLMLEQPETQVCYSDGYNIYELTKKRKSFSSFMNVKHYEGNIFRQLIKFNFINWQTVMINKKIAGNIVSFDEDLTHGEDYDILLSLSINGIFKFLDKKLVNYRIHGSNLSCDHDLMVKEFEIIISKYKNILNDKNINIDIDVSRSYLYGSTVVALIKEKKSTQKYMKYLLKYPRIQNIIIYIIIKLKLEILIRKMF